VLFLPGCPDSRLVARTGEAAAHRAAVRLVAVNRPGYGRSGRYPSDHLSVARDLVAAADRLGIGRFAVLGMSIGSPYALACAARHAERVSRVGVVASPAMPTAPDSPWHRDRLPDGQHAFIERLAGTTVDEAVALLRPDFLAYVARMAPEDPDDTALARRYVDELDPLDAGLVAALPAAEVAEVSREALTCPDGYLRDAAVTFRAWAFEPERIRCPVRLWYGGLDTNATVPNGEWLARRVPGAVLTVRDDAAHLGTLLRQWDEILTALR
jgi:pimeloyl-ACP methyl ester carboxylesterase